jgi:site-specific DNA-cytosine methylase
LVLFYEKGDKSLKLCVDLGSGQKGFSQAFTKDYEVITIDIKKELKPTIQADINFLPLIKKLGPDVLLMSPACDNFTLMSNQWPKNGIKEALTLVGSCLEAVNYLQPKKWLMENPKGRLRWFIGKPTNSIYYSDYDFNYKAQKPTDFWGNIRLPMPKAIRRPRTKLNGKHTKNFYQSFGSNPSNNAKIPLGVSQAILEACIS